MMSRMTGIFAIVMVFVTIVEPGNQGNNLVTCATCQALQLQFDSWRCNVNCEVVKGNNGKNISTFQSKNIFTDRICSMGQGYVFTNVCHSVHSGGRSDHPQPPDRNPLPLDRLPRPDIPLETHTTPRYGSLF